MQDRKCRQNGAEHDPSGYSARCRGPWKTTKSWYKVCVSAVETRLIRMTSSCSWNTPLLRWQTLPATTSKRESETDDRVADTGTPRVLKIVDSSSRPDYVPVRMTVNRRLEAVDHWLKM